MRRISRTILLGFTVPAWLGIALAFAGTPRLPDAANPVAPAVDAPAPKQEAGRPVCSRVGTRSEGWAWPSGHFIRWAKCKGVVPICHVADAKHDVEGWYAQGLLIVAARCSGT